MDDEIGKVLAALDKKKLRENTLIVWHSDNGGTTDARLAGEGHTAKPPCDNGPLNGGKGSNYEGGTRVPALANWPGHIKSGSEIKDMIHVVDMFPTLTKLAAAPEGQGKPLDGLDVWPALGEGKPSGRDEVVYNIEPFRAAVRQGDWKLVWKTVIPSKIELFNLADDPGEKTNLADKQPEKVKELQARIEKLAGEAVPPLFMEASVKAIFGGLMGPAPIPTEDNAGTAEP